MVVTQIAIKPGPSFADPADIAPLHIQTVDGNWHMLTARLRYRLLWRRFLIWAIRKHVERIK